MLLLVSLSDLSLQGSLSVEQAPASGSPCEKSTVGGDSSTGVHEENSCDDLTFAFALHKNLGVSESSLMFTVSE